ncbi:hypothetical protein Btru_061043 [Bulinus truncatus]|nr:hypothetical protein Btru_061043 [Bulinus truncatus]
MLGIRFADHDQVDNVTEFCAAFEFAVLWLKELRPSVLHRPGEAMRETELAVELRFFQNKKTRRNFSLVYEQLLEQSRLVQPHDFAYWLKSLLMLMANMFVTYIIHV